MFQSSYLRVMFRSVLNLSSIARECHVSRATVDGYLEVMEDLLTYGEGLEVAEQGAGWIDVLHEPPKLSE